MALWKFAFAVYYKLMSAAALRDCFFVSFFSVFCF